MDTEIGRFPCKVDRPEPIKFAWPVVVFPELFTTAAHLGFLRGYLSSIGWEVYAPDLRAAAGRSPTPQLARIRFGDLIALAEEALGALGREAIAIGHGIGGLIALALAGRARVKAAVAFAPMVPGFGTPLLTGARNIPATWFGRALRPPAGRVLFDFVTDADPFQRENLIKVLVRDATAAVREIAGGGIDLAPGDRAAPRLIVAGDSDRFAPIVPLTAFANSIGAQLKTLPGRGHWIIGGRALERAVNEAHRFLVRSLGQDLLLLFPEEWKSRPDDDENG
jgi:pimeloyl-ACP methyl ester carboxylesterase